MASFVRMLLFFVIVAAGPALVGYLLVPGSGIDDFDEVAEVQAVIDRVRAATPADVR